MNVGLQENKKKEHKVPLRCTTEAEYSRLLRLRKEPIYQSSNIAK